MTHLRVVTTDDHPTPPPTAPVEYDRAPNPPTSCVKCGAPARVTTETAEPNGLRRTFLLCANAHGFAVHWGVAI